MPRKYPNDHLQARIALVGSGLMAMTWVGLILMTLFVWYPRTVT